MFFSTNAFGLRIIDVSTPQAPRLLSNFEGKGRWVRGVELSDSMAYVATSMATGASWLQMVDISNPSAPIEAGTFPTLGVAQDVAVSDSVAYVADREGGLVVVDVSDPSKPRRRGFYRTQGNANQVTVCGGLVLLEIAGLRSNSLAILRYAH